MRSTPIFAPALFVIALLGGLMLTQPRAVAAELLMFEEKWCHWCDRWNEEIGVIYHKTTEGRIAPLRRVNIHGKFPDEIVLVSRPQYTPTFVLVDKGREIGRIEGYPGEDFFWGLLARLLERLPDGSSQSSDQAQAATN